METLGAQNYSNTIGFVPFMLFENQQLRTYNFSINFPAVGEKRKEFKFQRK